MLAGVSIDHYTRRALLNNHQHIPTDILVLEPGVGPGVPRGLHVG